MSVLRSEPDSGSNAAEVVVGVRDEELAPARVGVGVSSVLGDSWAST